MSGRSRSQPSALETAAQLRELIRDAHAATKDLRAAIREARAVAESAAREAHDAASGEMLLAAAHIQSEMNRSAAELNKSVEAARGHIMRQLAMSELRLGDDGQTLTVRWDAGTFDENVPLPGGPR